MTTIIISDLHLGSRNSQVGPLTQLLNTHFDRLILNGDTINNLNLKKLKPKHWRLMDRLRDVARERDLILVRGNHDVPSGASADGFGPNHVLATLLGVPLREEYRLRVAEREYLVLHGDRFDPTLRWPMVTDAADLCYRTVQGVNKKAAKWLKHRVKRLGGAIEFVKRRSVDHARTFGFDGIITGHTHFGDDDTIGGVRYLNTGCWVDWPCTYVFADAWTVELCQWSGSLAQRRPFQPAAPRCAEIDLESFAFRRDGHLVPSTN